MDMHRTNVLLPNEQVSHRVNVIKCAGDISKHEFVSASERLLDRWIV